MNSIFSWLSNESFRFFNRSERIEIMSRTCGCLRGTQTRTRHWIRNIFSPRPPTIHWNISSYTKELGGPIELGKSRMHLHIVQICTRKGRQAYYGQDNSPLAQKSAYIYKAVRNTARRSRYVALIRRFRIDTYFPY